MPRDKKAMKAARKRDNNQCCKCHTKVPGLEVHHIDGDPSNNSLDNLSTLCSLCHPGPMSPDQFQWWLTSCPSPLEYFLAAVANGIDLTQNLAKRYEEEIDALWHQIGAP